MATPARKRKTPMSQAERKWRNALQTGRLMGALFAFTSPFLFLAMLGAFADEYGTAVGTILALLGGGLWCVVGLLMIRWSRRARPPHWLRLQLLRKQLASAPDDDQDHGGEMNSVAENGSQQREP